MGSLSEYQLALATAVSGRTLSDSDCACLGPISEAGIAMTARVRRSWCRGRAARAAPLTLSALPGVQRDVVLDAWVDAGGGTSSLFEAEAEGLLGFIAERLPDPSHALALCRFERAVIRARQGADTFDETGRLEPDALLYRASAAGVITLTAPIETLLDALEGGGDWPPVNECEEALLVAPGVAGQVRLATERELQVWNAAARGVRAYFDFETVQSLFACGALCVSRQQP